MVIQPTGEILIRLNAPDYTKACEELQRIVFPQLSEDEILKEEQYNHHIKLFPEGQIIAFHENKVVGSSTCMCHDLVLENFTHHTFSEISSNGWLSHHNPKGEWIYGIDVSVHPDYRRKGIAGSFYGLRNRLAEKMHCKGQVIVGMLNGYHKYSDEMNIEHYFDAVKNHAIFDPTVSVQERLGFQIRSLIKNYLTDPTCGNAGALMAMELNARPAI